MKEVIVDAEDLVCLNKEKLQELIRCKDCKYYIADGCDECVLMSAKSKIAGINNKRWYSDFYCAWAERKER